MTRVLELNDTFHYGGPHLFMGILYASRPKAYGGDPDKARAHFLKASEIGEGKFLMTKVYLAQVLAKNTGDKALFKKTLEEVLASPADLVPELTLINALAQEKAGKLLAEINEIF
jgi:hypothetical protein